MTATFFGESMIYNMCSDRLSTLDRGMARWGNIRHRLLAPAAATIRKVQKQYYMNDWPNDMLPMRRWFLGMQLKVHRFPFARVTESLPHNYYKFMTSTPD